MQSIAPLTADDFKTKGKTPVSKLEVYVDSGQRLGSLDYDNLSGTFLAGETVRATSGAQGIVKSDDGSTLELTNCTGLFNDDEQITGGTSGATANVNHPDGAVGADGHVKNGAFVHDVDPPNDWDALSLADLDTEAEGQVGNCLEINENGRANPLVRQTVTGITEGKIYKFSFFVKQGTEATYMPNLYDLNNALDIWNPGLTEATGAWVEHIHTFEAPAGCSSIYISFYQICANGAGTTIYFDEISLYEIQYWVNICDLNGKNHLISANYSMGQRKQTYKPIAATFSAVIDNIDGLFHPQNNDSAYKDYFKVGRKIRFSTGFTQNSTDYLWQWFIGVISDADLDNVNRQVRIQGFDYMQYLSEVRLKSPDNYWGTTVTKSTVEDQAEYSMLGLGCNGVYIAYLDGDPIYEGKHWVYDRANSDFVFLPDYVPTADGTNDLVIYYYTTQIPENVVADILVSVGLYVDQAAALTAMDYIATGVTIERVMFSSGVNSLTAIQKLCERVDCRFYFTYNGTPVFKPIVEVGRWENRVFTFTKNLIAEPNYFENIDEVKNHIVIEGEKYSESDKYFKTVSGDNFLVGAIEVADGSITEAKMAANAITVTKIADNAIESPKIKAGAVIATKIFAGAIETDKLDALAVTAAKIAANTITAAKIAAGTITATEIAANTITAAKIAAGTITATEIAANTITAAKIAAGTITATEIAANTITTNQLKINLSNNTTEKLIMYQGSAVVEIMDWKGQNVNHQITAWPIWSIETDTFFTTRISDADHGGYFVCALADGECWAVYAVYAIMNADANTTKDGTASAVIVEEPLRGDPGNHTYGSWNENANLWGIRTVPAGGGEKMIFFVDEDGEFFSDGAGTVFQGEDDIQLMKDLEDILSGKISKSAMKEKDICKKHKVVNVSEVYDKVLKKKRLDRYVAWTKFNRLLMGTVLQLNEKIEALERRMN